MPRKARKLVDTCFFHIICQGINKEFIFNDNEDIKKYKNLIKKYKQDKVEIISYCIMNNHVHLLIYATKIEYLTDFMHKINTIYAIHYNKRNNRVGYVFRDRYKSQGIYSDNYLLRCIDYIHLNPVKAGICSKAEEYKHSSYNEYVGKKYLVTDNSIELVFGSKNYNYKIEYNDEEIMDIDTNQEKCKKIIENFINNNNINKNEILYNIERLKILIKKLHIDNKISYRIIEKEIGLKKDKLRRMIK